MTRSSFRERIARRRAARRANSDPAEPGWFTRKKEKLTFALAILGVLIGLHQYLRAQWAARVQRSLAIYATYQSGDVLKARAALNETLNNPEMLCRVHSYKRSDGSLHYPDLVPVIQDIMAQESVRADAFLVWSTIEQASICLSQGLCDQYTICNAFAEDGYHTYNLLVPYFATRNYAWDEEVQDTQGSAYASLQALCAPSALQCRSTDQAFSIRAGRYMRETFNLPLTRLRSCGTVPLDDCGSFWGARHCALDDENTCVLRDEYRCVPQEDEYQTPLIGSRLLTCPAPSPVDAVDAKK